MGGKGERHLWGVALGVVIDVSSSDWQMIFWLIKFSLSSGTSTIMKDDDTALPNSL